MFDVASNRLKIAKPRWSSLAGSQSLSALDGTSSTRVSRTGSQRSNMRRSGACGMEYRLRGRRAQHGRSRGFSALRPATTILTPRHRTPLDPAQNPGAESIALPALFQGRKRLRLGDSLIVVEEAAPKRGRRHEDRQNGDQTHTHTSPLRTRYALLNRTVQPPLEAHFRTEMVADLPQTAAMIRAGFGGPPRGSSAAYTLR
jgi:hypothetical protein